MREMQAPPHDKDAEAAVLGSIMLAPDTLHEVGHLLKPESFYDQAHRWIWKAMLDIDDKDGGKIDTITLADWLADQGRLDSVGTTRLTALTKAVPSSANAEAYAQTVRELYQRRQLLSDTTAVVARLQSREIDAESAVGELHDSVERVSGEVMQESDASLDACVKDEFARMQRVIDGDELPGLSTGIELVDELLGGSGVNFQRMYGIAALPKMGKSKFANVIAGHLAFEHGFAVDWWYTDGAREAIVRELVCWKAKIPTGKLKDPRSLTEQEWSRVARWMPEVKGLNGNVHAVGTPNVRDIVMRTKARLAKLDGKPMCLVVDYAQNCTAGYSGKDAETANVQEVSRKLAALRTDHKNLIILVLLQFNRGGAKKSIPQPHDLHGSSQLEKDLDHLMILHRPAELDEEATQDQKREGILWHALTKYNASDMATMHCDLALNKFGKADKWHSGF